MHAKLKFLCQRQLLNKKVSLNLLRIAGRFIDQRRKGQERIISITIDYKEITLMQMWVKSTH